ncbi:glycosyltransferase [Pedobacter sp. P351]|uniref:glycosyltransferase n=1 Tax=Pedobacter superstes TaxID=3133441 RepID=UPI0030A24084
MQSTTNIPFFSIILPVFNREDLISRSIQSVLQQSFESWELIVIDDGSTDSSVKVVEDFCRLDSRIKLLQQENRKQPAARNTGIKTAIGQWIAFIDSDDLWLHNKLELQYECILKKPEADVIFSDGYTQFSDKKIRHYYHYEIVHGFFTGSQLYKELLFGNCIPVLSLIIKSEWVSKIGLQDEAVPGVEDHDYCLRLCTAGANFFGMEDRLFVYSVHDNNFSANLGQQNYLSSLIRFKNYDPTLLGEKEIKRFKNLIDWYISYFKKLGKLDWAQDVKYRYEKLNLPSSPILARLRDGSASFIWNFKSQRNALIQRFNFLLFKVFYFYPKKKLSFYRDKLHTRYTFWLNPDNIKNAYSVQLSATANISFFNNSAGCLDVQSLFVGEFSRINFMDENATIIAGSDVAILKFCNFNIVGQLIIGNNVSFNNHSTLTCHEEIIIGDNSWFGEGVKIYDHNHKYKERNRPFTQQGYTTGKVEIGNNVWVGSNCIILPNVCIGDGCVIGANNVIYKSLAPNTIVKSKSMEIIDEIR